MTLVKFANGHNKRAVNPFFSDVFDSLINDSSIIGRGPAVNIAETENEFHIELAVPGLKKEDFKISLDKNVLSVAADKKVENVEEGKKYSKREYSYNSFSRSFTLPESADHAKIEADYTDGILTLNVPKKEEAKIQSREITIK
ncbi:Hsp20/alpha crystallin family protein [Mucilaginibacter gynuensis]|uniref:Hsp20/alpha crystallin family protein n=1 Tax=Mucilaginibacter gynuensis TaxID=1302236 RepID=A0ABP8H3A9_9SPHI